MRLFKKTQEPVVSTSLHLPVDCKPRFCTACGRKMPLLTYLAYFIVLGTFCAVGFSVGFALSLLSTGEALGVLVVTGGLLLTAIMQLTGGGF